MDSHSSTSSSGMSSLLFHLLFDADLFCFLSTGRTFGPLRRGILSRVCLAISQLLDCPLQNSALGAVDHPDLLNMEQSVSGLHEPEAVCLHVTVLYVICMNCISCTTPSPSIHFVATIKRKTAWLRRSKNMDYSSGVHMETLNYLSTSLSVTRRPALEESPSFQVIAHESGRQVRYAALRSCEIIYVYVSSYDCSIRNPSPSPF